MCLASSRLNARGGARGAMDTFKCCYYGAWYVLYVSAAIEAGATWLMAAPFCQRHWDKMPGFV